MNFGQIYGHAPFVFLTDCRVHRVGHNITLQTADETFGDVVLTTLSLQPLVFTIDPLLTKKECNHIIKKATPEMANSPVSHIDSDVGKPDTQWRTSTQVLRVFFLLAACYLRIF